MAQIQRLLLLKSKTTRVHFILTEGYINQQTLMRTGALSGDIVRI